MVALLQTVLWFPLILNCVDSMSMSEEDGQVQV
jgi:hypothetical protein